MKAIDMPKGIRNNNPGNIRISEDKWVGVDQMRTEQNRRLADRLRSQGKPHNVDFVVFTGPDYGIRAMCLTLYTYQDRRTSSDGTAIDTIRELVERWAPPTDGNPTEDYVDFMCSKTGYGEGEPLDFHDYDVMRRVIPALIHFENGVQPYPPQVIDKGLHLAGLDAEHKPMAQSRTMQAATVATAAGGLGLLESIAPAIEQLSPILPYLSNLPRWVVYVVILGAVGMVAWARLDDRKKGVR